VRDSASIRRSALLRSVPYFTTVAGARAAVGAIRALQSKSIGVRALQDIHASRLLKKPLSSEV
jgi:carbamoyl-phosphate synthase large subunit